LLLHTSRAMRSIGLLAFTLVCASGYVLQAQAPQSAPLLMQSASDPFQSSTSQGDASPDSTPNTNQGSTQSANTGPATSAIYGIDSGADAAGTVTNSGNRPGFGVATSLSTDQILSILQHQPEALVELKSFVADLAQQQGTPIEQDSLTDDMLYNRISSSPDLRASITTFLRVRGYITDEDLLNAATDRNESVVFSSGQDNGIPGRLAPSQTLGQQNSDYGFGAIHSTGTSPGVIDSRSNARSRTNFNDTSDPTAEPQVLHRPTPYNLLSLRDLYVQMPEQVGKLKRFGSEVFLHRDTFSFTLNGRETPFDVPPGPSYVVGPGDSLSIELWGGVTQSLTRLIDSEGRIALPESGSVQVAGLTLERVQGVISEALKPQYRNEQVAVTVAHLRSIRIYVVGDVQRPGAYDISSLSTSLNALYAAGGPTSIGSLRLLRHYRGKQLLGEIDLYDFLLHGVQSEDRLQAGDTLLVPPAGPQIAVYGAVKRPALYELKGTTTLASALNVAGGAIVAAELSHIVVDRIDANRQRVTISLDLPSASGPDAARAAIAAFVLHDGDHIHISPILPYSQRVVYVEGHVARPGRMPYRDGMHLGDVLQSYRDLLPEPADKGEIIRLMLPDLHPEIIDFSVPDALIGNDNLELQPFDTVRIYGRYEADAPRVTVGGEVLRPGTYALSSGMTAAQLVRMAGGFKRDALLESADLTSYRIVNGTTVVSERTSMRIGDAVLHQDRNADVPLKPGDVLTVHQITGWNDIGSSITVQGEVAHPGSYGIQQGERLSSILRRAGGFRETGYPAGAVLLREEVRKLEEKSRQELIRQIETSSAAARITPSLGSNDQAATLQLIAQQQEQVLTRLKSQPSSGRLVIQISADIASWENTSDDIEVRAGDVLHIPKRPGFVLVSGQVYNTSAITFTPDKTADWYLRRAGGPTEVANKKEIFIIRANGSVVGRGSSSMFGHDVLSTRLGPGDVVVVPQKIIGASVFWRNLLTVGQIASSVAITAAVAGLL
jgi:protein involved in polysaccharide export with SLBB domain